jgi:hypothetical protein
MMMAKIYLAAAYERADEMRGVRDVLEVFGHQVTSRWIDQETSGQTEAAGAAELSVDPAAYVKFARKDFEDISAADTVLSFTGAPGRGGHHIEFGIALALGKQLVIVGPRENVFHSLPQVDWYPDWSRLVMAWSPKSGG